MGGLSKRPKHLWTWLSFTMKAEHDVVGEGLKSVLYRVKEK